MAANGEHWNRRPSPLSTHLSKATQRAAPRALRTLAGTEEGHPEPQRPGSTTLPLGFQFALIENTSTSATTGTFLNLPEGGTVVVGSNQLAVFYDAVLDGDGTTNDVVLKVVSEPAGGALIGLGALVAGFARRRLRWRGFTGG